MVKLILKGILLYSTILVLMLVIMAADSLFDTGYLLISSIIIAILYLLCRQYLTARDLIKLSLTRQIEQLLKDK